MSGGLGLVLSGGGAPAAYFGAGVIQAVEDAGLKPRVLSGVSAGALNACALGVGLDAAALAEMWTKVGWRDIYRPRYDVWTLLNLNRLLHPSANLAEYLMGAVSWTWLLDTSPARRTLSRFLGGDELKTRDGTTVVVSAVDENSGGVVRFCTALPPAARRNAEFKQVRLQVDHLLASAAVPLLFPPGRVGDRTLVDAGLVANTPLAPVMAYEPELVIVVSGSGIKRPAPAVTSLAGAIALLVNNVAHFALIADYEHAKTVNTLVRAAPQETTKRAVPMLLIEPTDLSFSLDGFIRFNARTARRVMDYGRAEAARKLAGWSALAEREERPILAG